MLYNLDRAHTLQYTNCTAETESEVMKLTFLNRLLSSTSMFSVLRESTLH